MEIDSHIGCAMSGLTADARTMIDHARVTSQNHAFVYDEPVGVESCTQSISDLAMRFGESVEDDDALMVSRPRSFRSTYDIWMRGLILSGLLLPFLY